MILQILTGAYIDATYPMTLAITEFQKVLVNHSSNLGDDFNVFDPEDARLVSEFAFST